MLIFYAIGNCCNRRETSNKNLRSKFLERKLRSLRFLTVFLQECGGMLLYFCWKYFIIKRTGETESGKGKISGCKNFSNNIRHRRKCSRRI